MDFLKPIVSRDKLNSTFLTLIESEGYAPAKRIIEILSKNFSDPDGNFVEQFQTTGIDARVFEFYLNTYFDSVGFEINRSNERPDFLLKKDGLEIAVEATTSNPSPNREPVYPADKKIFDLNPEEIAAINKKCFDELPIRMGSPLFSKLNKKYWELHQCKGKPIILAIESFHEKGSLFFSDAQLSGYLYGLEHYPTWTVDGRLIVNAEKVENHSIGDKVIPSNFFGQPNAEYISAVIFSNSGTIPKFNRMGYQEGYNTDNVKIIRIGTYFNHDPNAAKPLSFFHNLDKILKQRNGKETWGEGLVVFHNPNAKHPIPIGFFPNACHSYIENGVFFADAPVFHPFVSITNVIELTRKKS